jgi:haloacetate dehalogenase
LERVNQVYQAADIEIRFDQVGAGPPLLLLHGFPQTRYACRLVAERLAKDFSLIVPDLPGYGESRFKGGDTQTIDNSKRHVANRLIEMMRHLGHNSFFVAGHDRGGRVGFRMAMDHPSVVSGFAALDVIPTIDVWESMDAKAAIKGFHWPFLAQPYPIPERLIERDPETFIGFFLQTWGGAGDWLTPEARHRYINQYRDAAVAHAACEDYRAGATVDWEQDTADRVVERKLQCPTLMIWNSGYLKSDWESLHRIWQRWCARDPQIIELPCGHFVMEEMPDAAADALKGFFNDLSE